jgi:hypothetical protein
MAEDAIGALSNLVTATAADRGMVAAPAQANSRLAKQVEDNSAELRELRLCSIISSVISLDKEASTHHLTFTIGGMTTRLVSLIRASPVNSQHPATNRRPLERITLKAVRKIENDVQGRNL